MRKCICIPKIPAFVEQPGAQPVISSGIVYRKELTDLIAEALHIQVVNRDSHYGKCVRKELGLHQIKQRRYELPFGEISSSAKENEDARSRGFARKVNCVLRTGRYSG